jgi:Chalcone isomerase-like
MRAPLLALAALTLAAPPAHAEDITEPATGHAFAAARDGMLLMGTGVRKKFVVKVYAMALYVDEAAAKQAFPALVSRAGGRDRGKLLASDHAQAFVMWGQFPKLGILHFVRDVDAEKIRGAYQESLEDELSDKAPPDMKKAAEGFVAAFDVDVKSGQEIQIRSGADGKITISIAGQKRELPANPKLARAVWGIWLGAKPISKDMRASLVDRIELLGK